MKVGPEHLIRPPIGGGLDFREAGILSKKGPLLILNRGLDFRVI